MPVPFDPKDHVIDGVKGERNRSELKEIYPANAWLENLLNHNARACSESSLSKGQLINYASELQAKLGAVYDISARRAGFLINQDKCGKHAARAIRDASDRTRKRFSSTAEERALPLIRGELLKAEIRSLAFNRAGSKPTRVVGENYGSPGVDRISDADKKARAEKNRAKRQRRKERERAEKLQALKQPNSEATSSKQTAPEKTRGTKESASSSSKGSSNTANG